MLKNYLFLLLMLVSLAVQGAQREVPATDEAITFTGRVMKTADGGVSYDWVGVYMQTEFSGSSIAIVVADEGTSYHNVFIDGKLVRKIMITGKEPHQVTLASRLKKGVHQLRLQKCTEGAYGRTTIYKVVTDAGAKLRPVAPAKRFIEIIGDSYTCGYGVESDSAKEHFKLETENCDKAYGCLIAHYFDADYALVAHSGQGMVRNWGDKHQTSQNTMPERWTRFYDNHGKESYDFKCYRPDLVIINLGTNDFSLTAIPTGSQFVDGYVKQIKAVKAQYGDVPVLCVTPHSASIYLKAAMAKLRDKTLAMSKVYMANPLDEVVTGEGDLGADYHPNVQGQAKIAFALIPQVSSIMHWPLDKLPQ